MISCRKSPSIWKNKKKLNKKVIIAYGFLLPGLLGVMIFKILPLLDVLRRSFYDASGTKAVGIKNYSLVLGNKAFLLALKNTALFTIICIPLLLCISLLVTLVINKLKQVDILKTFYLIPMVIPAASIVFVWKIFIEDNGIINNIIMSLGLEKVEFLNSSNVFIVLIFTYIWKNIGYHIILWMAGLLSISNDYYEAAKMDGANNWQCFRYITLPNLKSTIFISAILAIVNSFKVFREAYLIAGNYPDNSIYMLQHLFNNWFVNLEISKMCAAAVIFSIIIIVFIGVLYKLSKDKTNEERHNKIISKILNKVSK